MIHHFYTDLKAGKIDQFMVRLQALFANLTYDIGTKKENYYQSIFYIFIVLLGQFAEMEKRINSGRIDLVVRTQDYLYIFEFKVKNPINLALIQIEEKGYEIPFAAEGRKTVKVGVVFDAATRSIEEWAIDMAD